MHLSDLRHPKASLQKKLEALYARRTRSRVNWDSEGYIRLLHNMGDPHTKIPPVIHVAGTNGKGSIIAFLRSILEAQGYNVHSYTSPHLLRVNERFYVAGREISDDYLERMIDELQAQHNLEGLSFFEITTALAFKVFSENAADVVLLEVGMGGRLDCTNVIERPLATIISRISLDHTEFLGDSLSKIAAEKAGIIKPCVPCILSAQGGEEVTALVYEAVLEKAKLCSAPLLTYGREWTSFIDNESLTFGQEGRQAVRYPVPGLRGKHQAYNAGAALAALAAVSEDLSVEEEAIARGLASACWPGRLQKIDRSSLRMSGKGEIWLDCGHNDSAGEVLAQVTRDWAVDDPSPLLLILGMLAHKDARGFLDPLMPYIEEIFLTGIKGEEHSLRIDALKGRVEGSLNGKPLRVFSGVAEALYAARGHEGRILIAGSVYLAGDVLSLITPERAM